MRPKSHLWFYLQIVPFYRSSLTSPLLSSLYQTQIAKLLNAKEFELFFFFIKRIKVHVNLWKHKALHPCSLLVLTSFRLFGRALVNSGLRKSSARPAWWPSPRLCQRQVGLGSAAQPGRPGRKGRHGPLDVTCSVFFLHGGRDGWKKRERFWDTGDEKDSRHFLMQFFKCCQTVGEGLVIVFDCHCSDFCTGFSFSCLVLLRFLRFSKHFWKLEHMNGF